MNRIFNGRETELLAPVGTFEDFKNLLPSGADAFYMGGKSFNMRMLRKDYNLSNNELERAIYMAHEKNKKVYITFNNMMSNDEIQESKSYLEFLNKVQPDALIIQDFGAVKLIKDKGLDLNMHLSVMANVHNLSTIKLAHELGITRVVTSRELSFKDISSFVKEVPHMEYEYFIHGDMCSVHGSQCYYSGILFGKSSNRGQCMKSCRWPYTYKESNNKEYSLAVKDMCLYRHIPELLISGVNSFKIEGRMRGSDFLGSIINYYREAIDRFIEDPTGYSDNSEVSKIFYENRVRNLSTAYAFKKPGSSNIDITGEGEPKVFSRASEEFNIDEQRVEDVNHILKEGKSIKDNSVQLAVKVNNMEAFKKACDGGADLLYIAGEVFRPDKPFKKNDICEAVNYANAKKVYYVLPRMTYEKQFVELSYLIPELKKIGVAGLVVGNIGELYEFNDKELQLRGDFSLNIYNSEAAAFYESQGLSSVTLSIEAPIKVLKSAVESSNTPIEVIVQGAPAAMYLEHCLAAARHGVTSEDFCKDYCTEENFNLIDEKGIAHRVFSDQYCKNHIIPTKDICYLPILKELKNIGVQTFRIEAQHYTPEEVKKVTALYRSAIDNIENLQWNDELLSQLIDITKRKQSLQSFNY